MLLPQMLSLQHYLVARIPFSMRYIVERMENLLHTYVYIFSLYYSSVPHNLVTVCHGTNGTSNDLSWLCYLTASGALTTAYECRYFINKRKSGLK